MEGAALWLVVRLLHLSFTLLSPPLCPSCPFLQSLFSLLPPPAARAAAWKPLGLSANRPQRCRSLQGNGQVGARESRTQGAVRTRCCLGRCSYRGKLGPIPFPARSSARPAQIMGYPLSCGASRAACSLGTQVPSPFRSSRLHPSLLCPRSSQRSHAANAGPQGIACNPAAGPFHLPIPAAA